MILSWLGKALMLIQHSVFSRRFSSEKCPTLTVTSFFFVRLQSHSDWETFHTIKTTKTTTIRRYLKSGQRKLVQKGPPFHILLFYRSLQNRTRLKPPPPPFRFFFGIVRLFFKNFLMYQKSPPFDFFDILQQNIC